MRPRLSQSYKWLLIYGIEKGKICGCFKNSTSFVLQQCQNQVRFQRNGSAAVLKFLLNLLED